MSAPFKSSTVPRRRCGTFADMRASGDRAALLAESALALVGVRSILQAEDSERQADHQSDSGANEHSALPAEAGDELTADSAEHGTAEVGARKDNAKYGSRAFLEPVVDKDRSHQVSDERETEADNYTGNKPTDIAGVKRDSSEAANRKNNCAADNKAGVKLGEKLACDRLADCHRTGHTCEVESKLRHAGGVRILGVELSHKQADGVGDDARHGKQNGRDGDSYAPRSF